VIFDNYINLAIFLRIYAFLAEVDRIRNYPEFPDSSFLDLYFKNHLLLFEI